MAKAAQKDELLELPEGGIADFIMEDADAEAVYGTDEEVPASVVRKMIEAHGGLLEGEIPPLVS